MDTTPFSSLRHRLTPAALCLTLAGLPARAQQSPVDLITERILAGGTAAYVFGQSACERMLHAAEPATSALSELDAARSAVAARFQEPFGPGMDVWWTWRVAGSSDPFYPAVFSTTLAARPLADLVLLPHSHQTQVFAQFSEYVQAFLQQVPPSGVSVFVYSARFDSDLVNVGYAASGFVNGAELLCFAPVKVVGAGPVPAEQVAADLWVGVLHSISGSDPGLYDELVDWICGDVDTSMDGPLVLGESASPCNTAQLLQCMNQAWNGFVNAKSQLAQALKQQLAEEEAAHNQATWDAFWNGIAAMEEQAAYVTARGRLEGEPPPSYDPVKAALDEIRAGRDVQDEQLEAAHRERVARLKHENCKLITAALDNAIAQVIACFHLHCPDLEAQARAALAAARAELVASVGGC